MTVGGGGLKHESATPAAAANFVFFNPHPPIKRKTHPPHGKFLQTFLAVIKIPYVFIINRQTSPYVLIQKTVVR